MERRSVWGTLKRGVAVKKNKRNAFHTLAVHAGQDPDPAFGAVMTPIYATSTYAQKRLGEEIVFDYSRAGNPTRTSLEQCLAQLEGGRGAVAFASGMAAITSILHLFKSGDHLIVSRNVYGGVYRAFEQLFTNFNLKFSWVDTTDVRNVEKHITKDTKLVYIETPTNPVMEITDIRKIAVLAEKKGLLLAVDNTFMTPFFQRPLDLGADMVIHSTTKYLNGHSDSLGGAVVANDREILEKLRFIVKTTGGILSPFEAFLIHRGVKTLAVRMSKHEENGRAAADFLEKEKKVRKVFYPGLKSHAGKGIHETQSSGYGGMVAFDIGSYKAAKTFLENLRIFTLAESLGGVESLACHPATMTHASLPGKLRESLGVTDGLVRLSVGIEDSGELIDDIGRALIIATKR
jgi:cystathionine beta-lyase/cystathionine gamma-synthase